MLTRAVSLRIKEFGTEIKVTLHAFVCMYFHVCAMSASCACVFVIWVWKPTAFVLSAYLS